MENLLQLQKVSPLSSIEKIISPVIDIFAADSFLKMDFLGNYIFNYIIFAIIFVALMLLIKPL